jgi:hypothetical protein
MKRTGFGIGLVSTLFVICLGTACSRAMDMVYFPKTHEESIDYGILLNEPLTFSVPTTDQAAQAWGRIQAFVEKYSSMKIQIATNNVIETDQPPDAWHFAYRAQKEFLGAETKIWVECHTTYLGGSRRADLNSHVLAYYARTGELKIKFLAQYQMPIY